jgi:hypothetical protein
MIIHLYFNIILIVGTMDPDELIQLELERELEQMTITEVHTNEYIYIYACLYMPIY